MSGAVVYGGLDLTADPYLVTFDSDFGAGQAETGTVANLLIDGDVVSGLRTANRSITLTVEIASDSRSDFAAAEAALALQADQASNTLTLLFGDGSGQAMVADTFRAQLTPTYDGVSDLSFYRSYQLVIPALPFLRNPSPTTLGPSVTAALLLDSLDTAPSLTVATSVGTSNTGTVATDATHKTQGTAATVVAITQGNTGLLDHTLSRTFTATDLSAYGSVLFDVSRNNNAAAYAYVAFTFTLTDSAGKTAVYTTPQDHRLWHPKSGLFVTESISFTGGTVQAGFNPASVVKWSIRTFGSVNFGSVGPFGQQISWWYDNLLLQPAGLPNLSAPFGTVRFAGVNGVARTPVGLTVQTSTSGGARRVLLARYPDPPPGFNPVLTVPVSTSGTGIPTTSTSYLSGRYYTFLNGNSVTYRIPAWSVSGAYTLLARIGGATASTATTPTVTVTTKITGSTSSYSTSQVVTTPSVSPVTEETVLTQLAALTLPPQDLPPSNTAATIDITITMTGVTGTGVRLDDALFLLDRTGEIVLVDQPTGTHQQFFWLDAPQQSADTGAIYAGNSSDRTDALSVNNYTTGPTEIQLDPGDNMLLVVVDNASSTLGAQVNATYYERWLSERPS